MRKITLYHSFSARLSLYIILIAMTIFAAAFMFYIISARMQGKEEAVKHAESALSNTL